MHAAWYLIVAAMLTAWAVLDGFDFGAGIVHRVVTRDEKERGAILAAIGPVWDGNEVWLVAAGGVFVFAFPRAYAAAMSGMYLALVMVLWLLVLRGISIELRHQVDDALWRSGWDSVFAASSTVLAFVVGVALGDVLRGVPIDASGWFHLDLFAFGAGGRGALDAYTGLVGILAVAVLAAHGATYVTWKTRGELSERSARAALRTWVVAAVLAVGVTVATALVRPALFASLARRPWAWPLPLVALASPAVAMRALSRRRELTAFLASSAFIASLLLAVAATLYPVLLPSTLGAAFDLTATRAASGDEGLALGLAWWMPAMILAVLYFVNLFRSHRGKV